eukprot:1981722-Prymnesium_polylepis.2
MIRSQVTTAVQKLATPRLVRLARGAAFLDSPLSSSAKNVCSGFIVPKAVQDRIPARGAHMVSRHGLLTQLSAACVSQNERAHSVAFHATCVSNLIT